MLSVIGIGPGSQAMMTMDAIDALQAAEIVVGYKTYTHLVKAFTGDKQVIKTGMCKKIERSPASSAGGISTKSTTIGCCPIFRPFWSINGGSRQSEM